MPDVSIYKISERGGHSNVQLTPDTHAHLQAYYRDIDRFLARAATVIPTPLDSIATVGVTKPLLLRP